MKTDLYNQTGEKQGTVELNAKIFEYKINSALIHQLLRYQDSNGRIAAAHTKKRGEVKGGGAKPWRQKGTGRARQGSIRNPHFKGGSVVFGPRNERNYSLRMPKKQRRNALFSLLSAKLRDGEIMVLEGITEPQATLKTKEVKKLLKNLKIERKGLFIIPQKNDLYKNFQRAGNNIQNIKTILVNYLNPRDLLSHHQIIFFKESLPKLEELFLKNSQHE